MMAMFELAKIAGRAPQIGVQNRIGAPIGADPDRIGRAEYADDGAIKRHRKMHRPGIVGDADRGAAQERRKLRQRGFAREIARAGQLLRQLRGERLVVRRAEDDELESAFGQRLADGDEILDRPALGGAVFGAGAKQTLSDVASLAAVSPQPRAEPLWLRASASPDPEVAARAFAARDGGVLPGVAMTATLRWTASVIMAGNCS